MLKKLFLLPKINLSQVWRSSLITTVSSNKSDIKTNEQKFANHRATLKKIDDPRYRSALFPREHERPRARHNYVSRKVPFSLAHLIPRLDITVGRDQHFHNFRVSPRGGPVDRRPSILKQKNGKVIYEIDTL